MVTVREAFHCNGQRRWAAGQLGARREPRHRTATLPRLWDGPAAGLGRGARGCMGGHVGGHAGGHEGGARGAPGRPAAAAALLALGHELIYSLALVVHLGHDTRVHARVARPCPPPTCARASVRLSARAAPVSAAASLRPRQCGVRGLGLLVARSRSACGVQTRRGIHAQGARKDGAGTGASRCKSDRRALAPRRAAGTPPPQACALS